MILSFKHKGLEAFYTSGSVKGIQSKHAAKLRLILTALDIASEPADLNYPSFHLHPLKGDLLNFWSISVNGHWRVIFRFIDKNIELVNYLDYH